MSALQANENHRRRSVDGGDLGCVELIFHQRILATQDQHRKPSLRCPKGQSSGAVLYHIGGFLGDHHDG